MQHTFLSTWSSREEEVDEIDAERDERHDERGEAEHADDGQRHARDHQQRVNDEREHLQPRQTRQQLRLVHLHLLLARLLRKKNYVDKKTPSTKIQRIVYFFQPAGKPNRMGEPIESKYLISLYIYLTI